MTNVMIEKTYVGMCFSIPILVLTFFIIGPFAKRWVFVALWMLLFLGIAVFLIAAMAAYGMANVGTGDRNPVWEDNGPLPVWFGISMVLLIIGILIRPRKKRPSNEDAPAEQKKFPTLREAAAKAHHHERVSQTKDE